MFVCFFFSENVSFNETRTPISLILLFEFVSVFNSTNPLSFLGSSQLVKQYPRIRFYVISPAIKKKCTRSRQIKQSLSIINFFVSFLRSKNRYLLQIFWIKRSRIIYFSKMSHLAFRVPNLKPNHRTSKSKIVGILDRRFSLSSPSFKIYRQIPAINQSLDVPIS